MSFKKHLSAIKEAWKQENERRKTEQKSYMDSEFLPAALEVAETPPSPIGRSIMWLIIATVLIALSWSIIGNVDIVAVGQGRVVPIDRLQSIEAAEAGTVRNIFVHEGAKVTAGQPLLSLDPTFVQADFGAAVAEFNQATLAAARSHALLDYINGKQPRLIPPNDASPEAVLAEQAAVNSRINALEQKLASMDAREAAARSAIIAARVQLSRTQATIPLAQEQLSARQELDRKGYGARLVTLQAQERVVGLQYDAMSQRQEIAKANSELNMILRDRQQAKEEFRAQAATELSEAETASASRRETTTKARERARQQVLTAPLNGTIVEVAVTTIGEHVDGGAPLMTLVPEGQELVVEALIMNKDIGFIRENQNAIIKLEAYPFTRYGYLKGHVVRVAADAINDDKRGLVFPVSVKLDTMQLSKGEPTAGPIRLTPGMSVSVEIATGKRRLIDYLLSPISRATSEAGRER